MHTATREEPPKKKKKKKKLEWRPYLNFRGTSPPMQLDWSSPQNLEGAQHCNNRGAKLDTACIKEAPHSAPREKQSCTPHLERRIHSNNREWPLKLQIEMSQQTAPREEQHSTMQQNRRSHSTTREDNPRKSTTRGRAPQHFTTRVKPKCQN